jgi:hypothetical protein
MMTAIRFSLPALVAVSCGLGADSGIAPSACGPESARFQVRLTRQPTPLRRPTPGNALIYFIEDQAPQLCGICVETARIALDGNWVGADRNDSWLSFQVKAGEHHLCADLQRSRSQVPDEKRIALFGFTADSGAIYYFILRVLHTTSTTGPWIDLEPANRDEGEFLVSSYPESSSRPRK